MWNKCWIYKPCLSFPLLKGTLSLKMLSHYIKESAQTCLGQNTMLYILFWEKNRGNTWTKNDYAMVLTTWKSSRHGVIKKQTFKIILRSLKEMAYFSSQTLTLILPKMFFYFKQFLGGVGPKMRQKMSKFWVSLLR